MEKAVKNLQNNKKSSDVVVQPTQNPDDVIDLKELFWVLVGRWKMIFLAMLIGALLAGLYHTFLVKPSYQADASIFITSDESVISVAGLQVSSELTADYTRIVKSRNVLKQVIKDLDLDMNYKQLGELVNITNPDDSLQIMLKRNASSATAERLFHF